MSLKSKIDFAVVFRVRNANPNGDPLNGNRPRTTYEGLGEMTPECLKRKMRDRLMEEGFPIFVQSDDNKVDDHVNLRSRADEVFSKTNNRDEVIKMACDKWIDVRAFGQVFPFKAKGKKTEGSEDQTGNDKGVSIGIRGPVSIHPAFSLDRIEVISSQITKCTSLEGDGVNRAPDQMGMRHRVDHGIYAFYGSMNPQLAVKTGFSDEDAAAVKAVLPRLFENDESSARPAGSMEVLKVIWWQHNCRSGQCSSAKVHRSLKVMDTDDKEKLISFEPGKGPDDATENWPRPKVIDGV